LGSINPVDVSRTRNIIPVRVVHDVYAVMHEHCFEHEWENPTPDYIETFYAVSVCLTKQVSTYPYLRNSDQLLRSLLSGFRPGLGLFKF
jgi:hypothetical protein